MQPSSFIAVVDDDASLRQALASLFKSFEIDAETFCCGEDLLASPALGEFACFITDVVMPNMSGFELVEQLRKQGLRQPIIFMTAHKRDGYADRAHELGAACVLLKPFSTDEVMACVSEALGTSYEIDRGAQ